MLKVVSINRCEGKGIIERIEGNGWDIDADRIELNGINAYITEDLEYRIISLNGPAVEDLFKNLRDLLKENGKLRQDIEEQDECIRHLENGLKEKDAAIKTLQFDKDHYKKSCEILKRSIEEKEGHIKALDKYLGSKNAEIDELNNKLKKYDHTQISDANISHILPTLNAEINRLKEENNRLRKKADKGEKDFEAIKKHTAILENRVDEYERRLCGTTAIIPKPSPGYRICFDHINVSSVHRNSNGSYNICLWGGSVESLREKMSVLEQNNKAYSELCMSLQRITDRKEIPNERAYTEHDAD